MPFSFFDSSPSYFDYLGAAQQQAATSYSGLTLEDLWRPELQVQYPEQPSQISSVGDLDEERRRAIRRNAIAQIGIAFGQAANNPGQLGLALSNAAVDSGRFRDDQIGQANAFQQSEYQRQRAIAEQKVAQERAGMESENGRRRAESLLEMVRHISEAEPALAGQAELAARSGDTKRLQDLMQEVPKRAQMRQYGVDPDDPYADTRIEGVLKTQDEIEREKRLKELGLDSYFIKPEPSVEEAAARAGAIADAEARARARYRLPGEGTPEGIRPRFVETDDVWGMVSLDKDGNPIYRSAAGQPQRRGKWQVFQGDIAAENPLYRQPYRVNVDTGEVQPIRPPGAGPNTPPPAQRQKPAGGKAQAQSGKPAQDPAKQRIEAQARIVERSLGGGFTPQERKAVEQALAQGQSPGQVVAKIKKLRGQ